MIVIMHADLIVNSMEVIMMKICLFPTLSVSISDLYNYNDISHTSDDDYNNIHTEWL